MTVKLLPTWTIMLMMPNFPLSGPLSTSTVSPLNHIQSSSLEAIITPGRLEKFTTFKLVVREMSTSQRIREAFTKQKFKM